MEDELVYTTVVNELLKAVPELHPLYVDNQDMWEDDYLPYVVFGSVVVPTMEVMLKNDCENPILKRIFDFIELMMQSKQDDVNTLAAVEITEWIAFEPNDVIRTHATNLMGQRTLEEMNKMVNWRPKN